MAVDILVLRTVTNTAIPRQVPIWREAFVIPEPMPVFDFGKCLTEETKETVEKPNPEPTIIEKTIITLFGVVVVINENNSRLPAISSIPIKFTGMALILSDSRVARGIVTAIANETGMIIKAACKAS